MKTMSKRNKILLSIAGAVVLIVVVGLVLGLTGNLPLQGGIVSANLTPNRVCLEVGATQTFTLSNFSRDTSWSQYGTFAKKVSSDRTHFTIKAVTDSTGLEGGSLTVKGPAGLELDKSYFETRSTCDGCRAMAQQYADLNLTVTCLPSRLP